MIPLTTEGGSALPRLLRRSVALCALALLPGCFLFVAPEEPAEAIPRASRPDRRYYRLSEEDSFSCMRLHLPPRVNGERLPAAVIFPGGAYGVLALDKEGNDYAEFLNRHGIAAAVVKYPLGSVFGHFKRHPAMVNAARRAVRLLRFHAEALGIDPHRIGVMGSSAGGHLAGTVAFSPAEGDPASSDPAERCSARPDFVILCYPVVSMSAPCTHALSRENLLGASPPPQLAEELSLERRIRPGFPPVFLWLTLEDRTVDPENSRLLVEALKRCGVPHRAIFYPHGPHGMGLLSASERKRYPDAAQWPSEMLKFLADGKFIPEARQ